jgi:hypothetical protein
MAKAKLYPALKELHGSIGDLTFTPVGRDECIVRRRPKPPSRWSPAQTAHRELFAQAAAYGRSVEAEPERNAIYSAAARAKGVSPYHIGLADFLNPPRVTDIDLSSLTGRPGSVIRVSAEDDFEVARVQVVLQDLNGTTVEEGPAVYEQHSKLWIYTLRTAAEPGRAIRVWATATDHPGHSASKSAFWGCAPS